ncbi:hypothetical protein OIU78_029431 [Salix suchowensis]|nr:hypothetical protein OIU78_029431 [Salix suchowensis]
MAMVQSPKAATSSSPSLILTSGASGRIRALFSVQALKSLKSKDDRLLQEIGVHRTKLRVPATIVPWKSGGGSGVTAVVDSEVGGRRAIAIKRALQEDDPNTAREFSLFVSARGDTIFTQSWTSVSVKIRQILCLFFLFMSPPKTFECYNSYKFPCLEYLDALFSLSVDGISRGLVVLMHGLNEHSCRYSDFAKKLNANGFKVYGMDWIGHGGSDGLHGYVHSLDDAVDDLKSFLDKVLSENPGLPCFCFGHSTGAAIVLKAVMDPKVEARVSGVVFTSPAVGIQPSHPFCRVISFLLPTFQLSTSNKNGMPVSRDPEALVAKYSDPLVYTGFIRVKTGYEILRITAYLQQNLKRLRVPLLVLHGAADTVTDPDGSRKLYEEASSADKTIKLLEGFLHDLLFEPERDEIMADIIDWLNCRVVR